MADPVKQQLKALEGLLAGISIQVGLDIPEGLLVSTEPTVLEDECAVVGLAPAKGGLVGLDADTGRPMQLGWKYKSIDEKPVIIHSGARQTVIPPTPKPAPKPAPKPPANTGEIAAIYAAIMASRPAPPPPVDLGRPGPPRARQRVVDT